MNNQKQNIEKLKSRKCKTCDIAVNHLHTTRLCTPCGVQKEKLKKKKSGTPKNGKKKVKKKKWSVSRWKKEMDTIFSLYVRLSNADFQGNVTCVSCGRKYPWKDIQAGHFVSRSHNALRYDERNVHPQCVGCNVWKSGNYPQYAEWLMGTYGQEIIEQLNKEGREVKRFTTKELEEKHALYKTKLELFI